MSVQLPFEFVNNTPADADEVNANFSTIVNALNSHLQEINPHGVTPQQIGAETPEGAQQKATDALNAAKAYADQGIQDAHDAAEAAQDAAEAAQDAADALDPKVRFQVSGNVTAEIEIGGPIGSSRILQSVPVTIPAGKSLVLKRVRAYLDLDEQTLAMAWISASPGTGWQSGDGRPLSINVSPNKVLRENSSGDSEDVLVAFYVIASFDPFTLKVGSGWWLDLAIE